MSDREVGQGWTAWPVDGKRWQEKILRLDLHEGGWEGVNDEDGWEVNDEGGGTPKEK